MPKGVSATWAKTGMAAVIVLFAVGAILAAANVVLLARADANPLRYSLQTVGEYVVTAGERVEVTAKKCNDSSNAVAVTGKARWLRIDSAGETPYIAYGDYIYTLPPKACTTEVFHNRVPSAPGVWELRGEDCVFPSMDPCAEWTTEHIVVEAR